MWSSFVVVVLVLVVGSAARSADPNVTPPLCKAAAAGDLDQVRALLAQGTDVNEADYRGFQPIHRAAWSGHLDVVRVLLDAGADAGAGGVYEMETPVVQAVRRGHRDVVELLLSHEAARDMVDAPSLAGLRALHWAVKRNHADTIPLLLAAGADPNVRDAADATPLHLAVVFKCLECLRELRKSQHVDLWAPNGSQRSLLEVAKRRKVGPAIIEFLQEWEATTPKPKLEDVVKITATAQLPDGNTIKVEL